nr:MAG TPA: hypothetical protein [Caudoviricetes sp.]
MLLTVTISPVISLTNSIGFFILSIIPQPNQKAPLQGAFVASFLGVFSKPLFQPRQMPARQK